MTRWTLDNMAAAAMLIAAAEWIAWETAVAIGNTRAVVRDWRKRREVRVLNGVFAERGIGYRVGAAPKGAQT